ncbi:MAG: ATP-grasp domain-containing protein, partial [Cyanobacteria bacterium REEB65]|nr:ATP-grasp domain-containing protein [Cyanobacteria bacterium REEB65]
MSHILLLEVPGGTDFKILEEASRLGHRVTFFTSDLKFYLDLGTDRVGALALASAIIQVSPFSYEAFEREVLAIHSQIPFDAVCCLIDIRIVEASRIAAELGLPFLNVGSAQLLRDKFNVRRQLAERGIRQPRFMLATTNDEIVAALEAIGFPALVKPADGYGSQNIVRFASEEDLFPVREVLADYLLTSLDYGFGVSASNRLVVEELIEGTVVGCDCLTVAGEHRFLGINEKIFFPPPTYAIRGSCYPSTRFDEAAIQAYVLSVLDALGVDFGATHTELVI